MSPFRTCREVAADADRWLDGQLSPGERWAVRVHLWFCTSCRRYLGQLQLLRRALHGLDLDEVPEPLRRGALHAWDTRTDPGG